MLSLAFLRNISRGVLTELTCFSVDGLCFKLYSKLVIVATVSCSLVYFASHGYFKVIVYFFFRVSDKRDNLVYSDRLLVKRGTVLLLL